MRTSAAFPDSAGAILSFSAALQPVQRKTSLDDLPEVMPDLRLLVLFGSAARDRTRSESDIDLAVQCEGPADLEAV